MKFCQLVLKILSRNEILAKIKGHNSGTNVRKITCSNPNVDLVNINAYIKFGVILSNCSQDIERKQNYDEMTETTHIQYSPHFFKAGL